MVATHEPTVEQALALARRLSPRGRAELIGLLAQELVEPEIVPSSSSNDAWQRWDALRDDIAQNYPDAHLGDRLDADRSERDAALRGQLGSDDVHT